MLEGEQQLEAQELFLNRQSVMLTLLKFHKLSQIMIWITRKNLS